MEKQHATALFWFRRAVRIDDNRALNAALSAARTVIPVFLLDPTILRHPTTGPARTRFLFEALADVDRALRARGSRLVVRHGQPVEQILRLVDETGATALFFGRDYEPYSRERDKAVTDALATRGVEVHTENDHLLAEPNDVLSRGGTPFTVFTPYKRVWFERPLDEPADAPASLPAVIDALASDGLPTDPNSEGVTIPLSDQTPRVTGGEAQARRWLDKFIEDCMGDYRDERDYPAHEGTSRLSAYLRMGVLSPRRAVSEVRRRRAMLGPDGKTGADAWLSELAWRDFYYQILWHFPHVAGGAFRPAFDDIAWENDERRFQAWCEGKTGYPFVDAGQRQMNTEAWMHNRARMVSASFLTKDLLIDWRRGERYFMQKLIDGDLASNNGGWQWAAGTGTDAQPFFRIFNPVTQGEKFDPDGAYVRRYVPELANVPADFIHRPWEMKPEEQERAGCVIGRDYPAPVVDHKVQRAKALRLYRQEESAAAAEKVKKVKED